MGLRRLTWPELSVRYSVWMRVTSLSAAAPGPTILTLGSTKLVRAFSNFLKAARTLASLSVLPSSASTSLINVWMTAGHCGWGLGVGLRVRLGVGVWGLGLRVGVRVRVAVLQCLAKQRHDRGPLWFGFGVEG